VTMPEEKKSDVDTRKIVKQRNSVRDKHPRGGTEGGTFRCASRKKHAHLDLGGEFRGVDAAPWYDRGARETTQSYYVKEEASKG